MPIRSRRLRPAFPAGSTLRPAAFNYRYGAAFIDRRYVGQDAVVQAARHGFDLLAVKYAEAKREVVLLPRRRVVERSLGRAACFRRLARDYESLPHTVAEGQDVAFAGLMPGKTVSLFTSVS
jgi:transposase